MVCVCLLSDGKGMVRGEVFIEERAKAKEDNLPLRICAISSQFFFLYLYYIFITHAVLMLNSIGHVSF